MPASSSTSIRALLLSLGLVSSGIAACSGEVASSTFDGGTDSDTPIPGLGCGNGPIGACDAATDAPNDAPLLPDVPGAGCGNGPIGACDGGADAPSDALMLPDVPGSGCGNGPIGACDAGADAAKD